MLWRGLILAAMIVNIASRTDNRQNQKNEAPF